MSTIQYISTRDTNNRVTASQAILKGIAEDGGLYVPTTLPEVTLDWEVLKNQSYQEIAIEILSAFLTDFTKEEITACVHSAYDTTFDTKEIVPVKRVGDSHFMELFHGLLLSRIWRYPSCRTFSQLLLRKTSLTKKS